MSLLFFVFCFLIFCVRVCVYMWFSVCPCACVSLYVPMFVSVCGSLCVHAYVHVWFCVSVRMCVCVCVPTLVPTCVSDVFVNQCHFLRQAGHSEKAVCLFQALIEFTFFKPDNVRDLTTKQQVNLHTPTVP